MKDIEKLSLEYVKKIDNSLQAGSPVFLKNEGIWKVTIKISNGGVVGNLYFTNEKQFISEKSDSKEAIKHNANFRKKLHDSYQKLEKIEDKLHKHITFLKDLIFIIDGIIILGHLIGAGMPLGGKLKLIRPRDTYIRTDRSIFLKFEDVLDKKESIGNEFKYKISLREVDGDVVWGPHEVIKKIEQENIVIRNSEKYIVIEHLLDYKNFIADREYKWTVETEQEMKGAIFKVLDNTSLEFVNQVEQELGDSKLNIEDAFLLGALYESRGLYDDALEKYKFVATNDPSNIIVCQQISIVYAKKASKSFVKKADIEKLSSGDIQRDDVDLAHEADRWYKKFEKN